MAEDVREEVPADCYRSRITIHPGRDEMYKDKAHFLLPENKEASSIICRWMFDMSTNQNQTKEAWMSVITIEGSGLELRTHIT